MNQFVQYEDAHLDAPFTALPDTTPSGVLEELGRTRRVDAPPAEPVQELLGAADLNMAEATAVMAQTIGRPGMRYEPVPLALAEGEAR